MRDEQWIALAKFLHKLDLALGIGGTLLPPWNIFWWTLGTVFAGPFVFYRWWDGDIAGAMNLLQAIFFLPGTVLVLLIAALPETLVNRRAEAILKRLHAEQEKKNEEHAKEVIQATEWIMERLASAGIADAVPLVTPAFNWVNILFSVNPQQIEAYRETYAEAVKRFPALTPGEICGHANPLAPLDKDWADKHGIKEYAHEALPACPECGITTKKTLVFGDVQKPETAVVSASDDLMAMLSGLPAGLCDACRYKHFEPADPDDQ